MKLIFCYFRNFRQILLIKSKRIMQRIKILPPLLGPLCVCLHTQKILISNDVLVFLGLLCWQFLIIFDILKRGYFSLSRSFLTIFLIRSGYLGCASSLVICAGMVFLRYLNLQVVLPDFLYVLKSFLNLQKFSTFFIDMHHYINGSTR